MAYDDGTRTVPSPLTSRSEKSPNIQKFLAVANENTWSSYLAFMHIFCGSRLYLEIVALLSRVMPTSEYQMAKK